MTKVLYHNNQWFIKHNRQTDSEIKFKQAIIVGQTHFQFLAWLRLLSYVMYSLELNTLYMYTVCMCKSYQLIRLPTSTPVTQNWIVSPMWNSRWKVPNDLFLGMLAFFRFDNVLSITKTKWEWHLKNYCALMMNRGWGVHSDFSPCISPRYSLLGGGGRR